jgi:copper chaperone CopZ
MVVPMHRRGFLQLAGVGVASAGAVALTAVNRTHEVVFQVKGFTCVTCAVGLDTMLREQPGVASSKARWPEGDVVVSFDAAVTSAEKLRAFIDETTGFTVATTSLTATGV